ALAAHARTDGSGGHTQSDFDLVPVTGRQIADWESAYPGLADVWPLSPLQYGLLFHTHYDTETADGYLVQTRLSLTGPVDSGRLRSAAQNLVDRQENLRVVFVDTADGPRQLVIGDVRIQWAEIDLTAAPAAEMDQVIAADAATRFDLTRPPLLRFTLIRT